MNKGKDEEIMGIEGVGEDVAKEEEERIEDRWRSEYWYRIYNGNLCNYCDHRIFCICAI